MDVPYEKRIYDFKDEKIGPRISKVYNEFKDYINDLDMQYEIDKKSKYHKFSINMFNLISKFADTVWSIENELFILDKKYITNLSDFKIGATLKQQERALAIVFRDLRDKTEYTKEDVSEIKNLGGYKKSEYFKFTEKFYKILFDYEKKIKLLDNDLYRLELKDISFSPSPIKI